MKLLFATLLAASTLAIGDAQETDKPRNPDKKTINPIDNSHGPTPPSTTNSSLIPTVTVSPSTKPSASQHPSVSSSPTTKCVSTGSCTINPDPHFNIWDPSAWYDFQGGCDMHAIDNDIFEVQIRTRPRTWYSTITQLAFQIKATGEMFYANIDSGITNTIGNSGLATYSSTSGNSHKITLGDTDPVSYIQVYVTTGGISMNAFGCNNYFGGSEGMCGSFDTGGALYKDGTVVPFTGNYAADKITATSLAESWKITSGSLLINPSLVCDPSSSCGPGETFLCDDDRRRLQLNPGCTRACDDIAVQQFKDQCEKDIQVTGDPTWACAPAYIDPVIAVDRDVTGKAGKADKERGITAKAGKKKGTKSGKIFG